MAAAEDNSGRATVREVYQLVGEVRDELESARDALGAKIDQLGATVSDLVVSHEHRLTVTETTQVEHGGRLDDHAKRLKTLEESRAVAWGHASAFKWVIGGVIGLISVGFSGLIADLIYGLVK